MYKQVNGVYEKIGTNSYKTAIDGVTHENSQNDNFTFKTNGESHVIDIYEMDTEITNLFVAIEENNAPAGYKGIDRIILLEFVKKEGKWEFIKLKEAERPNSGGIKIV